MKIQWRPVMFFAVMLLAFDIAYSLLSTCQPPYGQAADQSYPEYNCTAFAGFIPAFYWYLLDILKRYEHELVAGFTIVLAISTIGLWLSTQALWEATKDTSELQALETKILQRAYISVEPAGIRALIGKDNTCHAAIDIFNKGHLPARKVRWFINSKPVSDDSLNDLPAPEDEAIGDNTVPPGTHMRQGGPGIVVGPKGLKQEDGLFLYVWGAVWYDDGFGLERTTFFCHRYNCMTLETIREPAGMSGVSRVIGYRIKRTYARYHRYGNAAN